MYILCIIVICNEITTQWEHFMGITKTNFQFSVSETNGEFKILHYLENNAYFILIFNKEDKFIRF